MSDKIKVLLVDDHALFRRRMQRLLRCYDDFEVVGDGPKGQIRILGTFTKEGDTLYIRGAHIEGPGASQVGYRDIIRVRTSIW
jgi:DNA-binding NarL/FixJ family response regulator